MTETFDINSLPGVQRMNSFRNLKEGDRLALNDGGIYIFIRFKRTKFIATSAQDGKIYDIPNDAFNHVVEKASPKQINQSYKTLRPGELFCIEGSKKETLLFKYTGMANGKIKAVDPFTNLPWTIAINFYLGKVSEIK